MALRSRRVYITLYNHSRTDDKTFGRVVESETGATIEFLETRLLLASLKLHGKAVGDLEPEGRTNHFTGVKF